MSKNIISSPDLLSTTSSPMINLAIYLRVSTDKQESNTSKKTQLETIENYIKEHEINVNRNYIYEDKYSGSKKPRSSSSDEEKPFTRRGLNELINDAKLKRFDTVMVYSHDRLTRNVQESLLLKVLFDKLNIAVIYCKPGENISTEDKKLNDFFENLLNNISALESNIIGSRTRLGNEFNVKSGYWAGGPAPYGYKLEKIYPGSRKSVLRISYSEARIVQEIFKLYLQGLSPVKIAEYIKKKYPDNTDRKWTKNSIISIIKNKDYTGIIEWDKKGGARNPIKHQSSITSRKYEENVVIEDSLWEQMQTVRKIQKKQPKFFSSQFLLNGYLECGKCGKLMKAKNNGGSKGRVYYCQKEKGTWESCINAEPIETQVFQKLGEHLTLMLSSEENFNRFYEKYKTDFESRKNVYKSASKELQLQIEENAKYLGECNSEIARLQSELNHKETGYENRHSFIESLKELCTYLRINETVLANKKTEVDSKIKTEILSIDSLKEFILQKKNLLDSIKSKIPDEEIYRRSLKLLIYDLVDKITYCEDNSINIIIGSN